MTHNVGGYGVRENGRGHRDLALVKLLFEWLTADPICVIKRPRVFGCLIHAIP